MYVVFSVHCYPQTCLKSLLGHCTILQPKQYGPTETKSSVCVVSMWHTDITVNYTSMSVGTDVYPHMPILLPHAARYSTNGNSLAWRLRRCISTVMCTSHSQWTWPARWPICPILGIWGSKVYKNVRFPALDADEPPWKIWCCSFILGGEIRNRAIAYSEAYRLRNGSGVRIQQYDSSIVRCRYSSLVSIIKINLWNGQTFQRPVNRPPMKCPPVNSPQTSRTKFNKQPAMFYFLFAHSLI